MNRTHKIRIYPNDKQEAYLLQCCGASRFAYNTCLAKWNEDYESSEQIKHNYFSIKKWFNSCKNDDFPWVYGYSKWIYEAAIQDLDRAFKGFFKGIR